MFVENVICMYFKYFIKLINKKQIFNLIFIICRFTRRSKRDIQQNILLECQYKFKQGCTTTNCRDNAKKRIKEIISKTTTVPDVPCTVTSRQFGPKTTTLQLTFDGISGKYLLHLHLSLYL